MVDIHISPVPLERSDRMFGGVAFIVNSIMQFERLIKMLQTAHQSVTIRAVGSILPEMSISPKTL